MLDTAMDLAAEVAVWSLAAFALLLFLVQLVAREFGYWLGRRHQARTAGQGEGVGILVGAVLGLLAFTLALTLSFANTRFAERRAGTLAEANAIGTAWLRAEAIADPRSADVARLLEQYARVRADFVRAPLGAEATAAMNNRTSELQNQIWKQVTALIVDHPNPVTVSLMSAVNDTFDTSTAERFAHAFTLPAQLFWLLIAMALLGMMVLGFQLGLRGTPLRLLSVILTVMWTIIIVSIFDLASARVGSIRTSTMAYEWTIRGFGTGTQP